MGFAILFFLTVLLHLHVRPAGSIHVNRTVDDKYGDEIGNMPYYSPGWTQGNTCGECSVNDTIVDISRAFDKTWHDSTYCVGGPERNISLHFTGTAVYVFALLANQIWATTTMTNLTFYLDEAFAGRFLHVPDNSTDFRYNASIFSMDGLRNIPHHFEIRMGGPSASPLLFDYAVYTAEEDDTTLSTPRPLTVQTSGFPASRATTISSNISSSSLWSSFPPTTSWVLPYSSTITPAACPFPGDPSSYSTSPSPQLGPIIGGTVGGFALGIIAAVLFHVARRWHVASPGPGSPLNSLVLHPPLSSEDKTSALAVHGGSFSINIPPLSLTVRSVDTLKPRLSTRLFFNVRSEKCQGPLTPLSEHTEPPPSEPPFSPSSVWAMHAPTATAGARHDPSTVRHSDASSSSLSSAGWSQAETSITWSAM